MARIIAVAVWLVLLVVTTTGAQTRPSAATTRATGFPHIEIDVDRQQVRVACTMLDVSAPLEFLCVVEGGPEHESMLRTNAKPSHLHTALLVLGLEPGHAARYDEAQDKWLPPDGAALKLSLEFRKDGQTITAPVTRFLHDIKSGEQVPETTWVFVGSKVLEEHGYAADLTGYLASVVNFEYTVIDLPQVASNSNESLELRLDLDKLPPRGTPATLIIEPAPKPAQPDPMTKPAPATLPVDGAAP